MNEKKTLAMNLRRYRLLAGLKQEDLAAKIGLSKDTISKIELGKQENIGLKYLVSICRELEISIEELFMEDPEALYLKFVVSDQNLPNLEKLIARVVDIFGKKEAPVNNRKRTGK